MNRSPLPHSLRIIIFLLRLVMGLNFLYIGIAALFNASVMKSLHGQSFTGLYTWLMSPGGSGSLHTLFAYAFLAIGACLILGLATRLASVLGIVLVIMSYWPSVSPAPTIYALANIDVIVTLCLLILLFSKAGAYIGLDMFIHVHLPGRQKKQP
jgi:uncharacterized membrane protein YphA (DoxX/SURF4 family)